MITLEEAEKYGYSKGYFDGMKDAQKEFLEWLDSHMNKFYTNKIVLIKEDIEELKKAVKK